MKLALYAHPFDLDALRDRGGLQRVADLGIGEIALATSYHDGRWLQPWHPDTRVRFLEDGTVHFRPGRDYGVLQPLPSTFVPQDGPTPLERLCAEAPAAGLAVRAWNVFTHNSRLGSQYPELCVENAFGDRYVYALCPSQPEVQRYILAMVRDLGGHDGVSTIELEAFGWMGWKHGSHHDKASFTPKGVLDWALSLCFCESCRQQMHAADMGDPEAARRWARDLIDRCVTNGDAMQPSVVPEALDETAEEVALVAWETRLSVLSALGRAIAGAMPKSVDRAAQVHPARLFSGSQAPIMGTKGLSASEYVITAYGESPTGIERLLRGGEMHLLDGRAKRLSIWPRSPQFTSDADLVKVRDLCAEHGIASIAIYHLGLLPWRTIERAARILAA